MSRVTNGRHQVSKEVDAWAPAPTLTSEAPVKAPGRAAPQAGEDKLDAARAASGDEIAFERLYRQHAERVHALARRLVGEDQADDATQDVFIRAWERLSSYRGEAAFGTWLHRLAVNVLIRRARSVSRIARDRVDLDNTQLTAAPRHEEDRMDIESALQGLDSGARAVIVLHDMEGYSHEEIARTLGISVTAARMRLHRGRMSLRAFIRR